MNRLDNYLKAKDNNYLIKCFKEIEEWETNGSLEPELINDLKEDLGIIITQFHTINVLIYKEMAKRFVSAHLENE